MNRPSAPPRPESLLRRWSRDQRIALMAVVDSRSVRLFQLIMYVGFALGGIYTVFYAERPETVSRVMDHNLYLAWGWLNIIAPVMTLIGFLPSFNRAVRDRNLATKSKTSKVLFQLFGNIGVFAAITAYVYSQWITGYWGKSMIAFCESAGLGGCVALLIFGDLRALFQAEWVGSRGRR